MYYWVLLKIASPSENSIWLNCSPFFLLKKKSETALGVPGSISFTDTEVLSFSLVLARRQASDDHFLFFLGNGTLFWAIQKKNPHPYSHILYSISHYFHVRRVAGDTRVERDQDSAGGSTSSSTGFGSFVRIASASSYIWKRANKSLMHGIVNTKMQSWGIWRGRRSRISYRHELHILEKFLYETSRGQAKHTVG